MPTYAYRCTACAHEFDVFQKFSDQPISACPECGSAVRKVFQPVGIVFKGSGWYINDSRKPEADPAKAGDTTPKPESADAKSTDSKTPDKAATKATEPATPKSASATPAAANSAAG